MYNFEWEAQMRHQHNQQEAAHLHLLAHLPTPPLRVRLGGWLRQLARLLDPPPAPEPAQQCKC